MSGPLLAMPLLMDAERDADLTDTQTYQIIRAGFEVHRELGCGFLEQVYQDALTVEFVDRKIPFEREVIMRVPFKGRVLGSFYRPDFICFGQVIVEVKASEHITAVDLAQVINYLKVSRVERALILNFGGRCMDIKRVIRSEGYRRARVVEDGAPVVE